MEWRLQTTVSCADAFTEAQRWIQEVTGKLFGCNDFRAALENGVLLCDLINQLKPGIIKRVNRLSTPIAGLDNVNVFLKACGNLGLNVSQLFHPGDLQDLSTRATLRRDESSRRLKNVLITIYWLGRKAHLDAFYSGPQLNFRAFEGLLGLPLSKSLDEGSNVFVRDGGYREGWYPERDEFRRMRPSYSTEKDGIDSPDPRAHRPHSEGCGSDAEAEQVFKMETTQTLTQQHKGYIPPPLLRRKQAQEETRGGSASPLARSKSLSDIPMVYPVRKVPDGGTIYDVDLSGEWSEQNKRRCSVASKDSEAQWHDDLTKWKNRRRSTKSDLRRKSQDREHVINQMSNGAVTNLEKKEVQGRLLKRDQQSPRRHNPAPRPYSTSPPSKTSSSDLRPRTRALLARSYATEAPFSPSASLSPHHSAHTQGPSVMPASDGNIFGDETHFASLASDGAGVTTPSLDCPFSSQTQVKSEGSPAPFQPTSEPALPQYVITNQISTLTTTLQPNQNSKSASSRDLTAFTLSHKEATSHCLDPKVPPFPNFSVNQAEVDPLSLQKHKSQEEIQKTHWDPAVEPVTGQQTASVNKYLSRAGTWSGSASLPRGYRRSEGSSRLSSAITARPFGSKQSRMSSLPRLCNVDNNQDPLLKSEKQECSPPPPAEPSLKRQTATIYLKGQSPAAAGPGKATQANGAEPGEEVKGATFSSQAHFQANGYHCQPLGQTQPPPQPSSNLQVHHNKPSSPPANGKTDSQKVDHSDMRVSITLKPNSRQDFGFETHWDSTGSRVKFIQPGSPAELCQLCVDDEIVAVNGVAVAHMNYTQWKDKMTSSLQTGSLTMDIRRYGNKDWSTGEGSHLQQSGQSRMTLNLTTAAPVLIGGAGHHANNGASTITKESPFNGQANNVMQGKVMQGELADIHRTAKTKGGSESAISDLQVPSLSPSSSSWSWDREEDRRRQEKWQEEQERLLQEQYQRDQERLQAEWQRAQQDAEGELSRKSGQNIFDMANGSDPRVSTQLHVNGFTNKPGEEQSPELKDGGIKPSSYATGAHNDNMTDPSWAANSCGFAQLSPAHRAKSMSTPALASPYKQTRGDQRKTLGQSVSKVEQERQQILEEMKKRTQLLTDNSWIRQRSSSFYKEPIYVGVPMKRYESLDNLDTMRQSSLSTATFTYPRPHSAAAGYFAPSRNSSSRYSTGAVSSQKSVTLDPSHDAGVWAAVDISGELRLEPRFESETGNRTASSAISNSNPLVSPLCDQHTILQITE